MSISKRIEFLFVDDQKSADILCEEGGGGEVER